MALLTAEQLLKTQSKYERQAREYDRRSATFNALHVPALRAVKDAIGKEVAAAMVKEPGRSAEFIAEGLQRVEAAQDAFVKARTAYGC